MEKNCNHLNYYGDYQVLVPAQLTLHLLKIPDVKNFVINTQLDKDSQRNYFTVKIEFFDGSTEYYAFLLNNWSKNTNRNEEKLSPEKYQKNVEELEGKYRLVLYCNSPFDKIIDVKSFDSIKVDTAKQREIFNSKLVYKFWLSHETTTSDSLAGFSLFVNKNENELKEFIQTKFIKLSENYQSAASKYLKFFRDWQTNPFKTKLNLETVTIQLNKLIMSPYVVAYLDIGLKTDKRHKLIERAIQCFDVTLLEEIDEFLADGICYKFEEKEEASPKLNSNFKHIYQVVEITAENKSFMLEFIKLCQKATNWKLLFRDDTHESFPSNLKVFKTLKDLLRSSRFVYNQLVNEPTVSLQGREYISIKQLYNEDIDLMNNTTISDLIRMLKNNFVIGEQLGLHYNCYLSRSVSKSFFNLHDITKIKTGFIVISANNQTLNVAENSNIIKFNSFCKDDELKLIIQESEGNNVHHFVAATSTELEWATTIGNIDVLKEIKQTTKYVKESQLQIIGFYNRVIVLSGHIGIGKTTMINYLQKCCPSTHWTLKIDLKEHNSYFKHHRHCHIKETLTYFLNFITNKFGYNKIDDKIRKYFAARNKIIIFWDGLDELQRDNVKSAIEIIKKFRSKGYRQWVTSRLNLRKYLEDLDPFFYEINEITFDEQEEYVRKNLKNHKKIHEIIPKLFGNNHLIVGNSILGAPLQMRMITEVLLENSDKSPEFVTHISVLTHMFHEFVIGKFRKYLDQVPVGLVKDAQASRFRAYRAFGMKSCFKSEILDGCLDILTLKQLNEDVKNNVSSFRNYGDYLGFVVGVSDDNAAIFEHNVFAEFFAACWMVLNVEHIGNFQTFIFKEEYNNIRYFFDMKLAEEHPEHLTILYRHWQEKATSETRNTATVGDETTSFAKLRYLTLD